MSKVIARTNPSLIFESDRLAPHGDTGSAIEFYQRFDAGKLAIVIQAEIEIVAEPKYGFSGFVLALEGCMAQNRSELEVIKDLQQNLQDLIASYGGVQKTPWNHNPPRRKPGLCTNRYIQVEIVEEQKAKSD